MCHVFRIQDDAVETHQRGDMLVVPLLADTIVDTLTISALKLIMPTITAAPTRHATVTSLLLLR